MTQDPIFKITEELINFQWWYKIQLIEFVHVEDVEQ